MSDLGKPFLKKTDQNNQKEQKINVKMPLARKTTSEKYKFDLNKKTRPRMNYEWIGKILYYTVFSLYFNIRAKKIHTAKPFAFSLHFFFRRDQNH